MEPLTEEPPIYTEFRVTKLLDAMPGYKYADGLHQHAIGELVRFIGFAKRDVGDVMWCRQASESINLYHCEQLEPTGRVVGKPFEPPPFDEWLKEFQARP